MTTWLVRMTGVGLSLALLVTPPLVAQSSVADIAERSGPAVFQVIGDFGHGSGVLYDAANGLVLTNAHVTAGLDSVRVKLSPRYKVAGAVVHEDRLTDVAVVRVSPAAVGGIQALSASTEAFEALRVGEPVVILGFPGSLGPVTTTGIVSQKREGLFLTDAGASPGNSGGPALDAEGRLVGITTFGTNPVSGTGLQGSVSMHQVVPMIDGLSVSGPAPPPDSLPVIPLDDFPITALERALTEEEWPDDLYDVTATGIGDGGSYNVTVVTPPFLARHTLELGDLSHWRHELGAFPPVVVLRVFPRVGQSGWGVLANLALAVIGGATDTYFLPVWAPVAKGSIVGSRVQGPTGEVVPLQRRWSRVLREGVPVTVLHIVLSPEAFRPNEDGGLGSFTLSVEDANGGTRYWLLPEETVQQVAQDFLEYFQR